jgi:hypothetical protein
MDREEHGTGRLQWRLPWQSMACRGKEVYSTWIGDGRGTNDDGSHLPVKKNVFI